MAYLLATYPETFEVVEKNNVDLFHGTRFSALPTIMKYGLDNYNKLIENNINVTTGEEWSRGLSGRKFVSLTDDLDTASGYSSFPEKNDAIKSFGVVLGMSSENIKKLRVRGIQSDCVEIGVFDNIPVQYIKMIGVPEDKVEFVQRLINNDTIKVLPMQLDVEKFFYGWNEYDLIFSQEDFEKAIETTKPKKQQFSKEQMEKLAKGREKSGIQHVFQKIKNLLNRGKENGKNPRE